MGLLLLILLLSVPHTLADKAKYTITAPNTIKRNSVFQIAVTNHGPCDDKPLVVHVRLIGEVYAGDNIATRTYSASGEISVAESNTKLLILKIGNWEPGNYRLECNGSGAATFRRNINVNFNNKQLSILIQTDKGIYQLGQIVYFRIVVFDSNLLPYKNGTLTVFIVDADGNRIKQWDIPVPKTGIYENEFQLSDQPVMGQWQLHARIQDEEAISYVEVSHYITPKFDVVVTSSAVVTQDDVQFPVTFTALYTNGGKVSGTYVVNVTETYCTYAYAYCRSRPVLLYGKFKGTAQVIIRIGDLMLDKSTYYGGSLTVRVIVTEDLTGIKRNSSTTVNIYQNSQQLSVQHESFFKPKIPFSFTVALLFSNGAQVSNSPKGQVNITVNYGDGFDPEILSGTFKADGSLSKTVTPPSYAESLNIEVKYKELTGYGGASLYPSLSDKYISISVVNKSPKVGDTLTIKVIATFKIDGPFSYQVVGRGAILLVKTEILSANSFSFKLTKDMAPHVRIVVFYVTQCGEMVGDSLDVSVAGILQNQVTLTLSSNTTEPGKNVTLSIACKPDSAVGLSAVDQSVLLLHSGNDITKEMIVNEVQRYDTLGSYYYFDSYYGGRLRRPPSGGSTAQIFQFAGLELVATNCLVLKQTNCRGPIYFGKGIFADGGGGPMELEGISGGSGGMVQPTRTRKYFPETILWSTKHTNNNGKAQTIITAPDSLTSWSITAISMNYKDGLGTSDAPTNLTVTMKFFIVINMPLYVIRNEVVTIIILVFNNLPQDLPEVVVTLNKADKPSAYDFLEPSGDDNNVLTKRIKIGANSVESVSFRVRPKEAGYSNMRVKAVSPLAGDEIVQPLLVKPEGTTIYMVNSKLVDLRETKSFTGTISISIPANAVPNSQFIECTAIGDIMAPVVANIKKLIRMPSGCGEQNLLSFCPDIQILVYLKFTDQLTPDLEKTLVSFMEKGYQNQLNYKRQDGSFSAFGKTDTNGSTWLTAYTVTCFLAGADYITIDQKVIDDGKKFLASKQENDGQFREDGRVIHKAMQGGSADGLAYTAFILRTFFEKKNQDNSAYTSVIQKGIKFVEDNMDSANNSYDMAVVCYLLHLANRPTKNSMFAKLNARKIIEGDLSHWSYSESTSTTTQTYDIETTAYVLLILNLRPDTTLDDRISVARWLISKSNNLGGYESSQDTVMAIQALASVAPKFAAPTGTSINLSFTYLGNTTTFILNKDTALLLQKVQIPKETRIVSVRATGNGVGIAQCAWNYNVANIKAPIPYFSLIPTVRRPNDRSYSVDILVSALYNNTGMVLVEFKCLSGYQLDDDSLPDPGSIKHFTRRETNPGYTEITLYFDEMLTAPLNVRITLNCVKNFDVEELKNAYIRAYDYYQNYKRIEVSYNLPPTIG